jgi:predicted transcriptional regulator
MSAIKAGDIMVPLDEYPMVDSSATILDAVTRIDELRRTMEGGRNPYQAVLVTDQNGDIVGKMGQLAFLRALEPRSQIVEDQDTLDKAGVSDSVMQTALDHFSVLHRGLDEMCLGASGLPVRSVMHPFKEHIDVDASICDVIHQMVVWQTLSVLVTEQDRPVGLVRLTDLWDVVMGEMKNTTADSDSEG